MNVPSAVVANSNGVLVVTAVDHVSGKLVGKAIDGCGFRHQTCASFAEALAIAEGHPGGPVILINEARDRTTSLRLPRNVHLLSVAGPGHAASTTAGGIDVLTRPISVVDLQSRLRETAARLQRLDSQSLGSVLDDVVRGGLSGEIGVAADDDFARLHVHAGRLAWIHRTNGRVSVQSLLQKSGVELDGSTVREVRRECHEQRRYFGDVLVEWGLVEREHLVACLRDHLAEELSILARWPQAVATFIPDARPASQSVTFELGELRWSASSARRMYTEPPIPSSSSTASLSVDEAQTWVDEVSASEPVECALLDATEGTVLGSCGLTPEEIETAWSLTAALVSLRSSREEVIGMTTDHAFLVRSAMPRFDAVLVLRFELSKLNPAMARVLAHQLVEGASRVRRRNLPS